MKQNSITSAGAAADSSTQPIANSSADIAVNPMLAAVRSKKARCYNCKYASTQFKIVNLTHLQCLHPKHKEGFENGTITAWDTLQIFSNTCETHEFKNV